MSERGESSSEGRPPIRVKAKAGSSSGASGGPRDADQFNIRWNNYTAVLQSVFRKLLSGEQFVDVTLSCEGKSIKCHRVILSACSTYFERVLTDNPAPHLVILIKDMKFWELEALVTFMYNGEVSVNQNKLAGLVKAAESLKIKGLAPDASRAEGDRIDDDDIEEYQEDDLTHSLLRPNLKAALKRQRPPAPLPKLVKMQKLERSNGPDNSRLSNVSGGESSMVKEEIDEMEVADPGGEEEGDSDGGIEPEVADDGGSSSEVEDGSGGLSGGTRGRIAYKYGKEIRDSALAALGSGMSLRQCSDAFGIPRKTLSKWKAREAPDEVNHPISKEECADEGVVVVRRSTGPVLDSADRAERLQKAMELALSGVTVRQAAAHYDIPRTTLCAYMKRRGVAPKRNFLPAARKKAASLDDFPFLGISELMDEMGGGLGGPELLTHHPQ